MSILVQIVFGGLVGFLISVFLGAKGVIVDIFFGIIGAFLGGWIITLFGKSGITGFNLYSIIISITGAIILIGVSRAFRSKPLF